MKLMRQKHKFFTEYFFSSPLRSDTIWREAERGMLLALGRCYELLSFTWYSCRYLEFDMMKHILYICP